LAKKLTEAGVAVFTFDGRGHGKSCKPKPTAYFDRYEDYLKDIDALFGKVKNYLPGLPAFIFGHSMGGGMVAAYCLAYKPYANGIILSAPLLKPAEGTSKGLIAVASLLGRLVPRQKVMEVDANLVSRDPSEVKKYNDDPLNYHEKITARTGHQLLRMMRFISEHTEKFDLPLLLMHGTADGLTNPDGSREFFKKLKGSDVTLKLYPDAYHELINDLDREAVMGEIVGWISSRQ
jgi:alpha-beta hydrolase superfamily lysophospholipase